jgi:hypothetical protein
MTKKKSIFPTIIVTVSAVSLLIFLSNSGLSIANVQLTTHSFEGNKENISIKFNEPVNDDVYLEVYEFHYIMHPEFAPQEDTWPHERQMQFMQDVLSGNAEPFKPKLSDENIKKILEISSKETIKLETLDNQVFYTGWTTKHGRIFFRVKTGNDYLNNIYTMRVHCKHIDIRTAEKLKDLLQAMKLPLEHKNGLVVQQLFEHVYATYTQGHSLQFILRHHEQQINDLDALFEQLEQTVSKSAFGQAKNLIVQIEQKINEKEEIFFKLDVLKNDDFISVAIEDNINDYSFYSDPNVEVYVKEYEEPSIEELMGQVHSMPTDHSKIDPSMHMRMLQPDKDKLIDGAIRLENSVNAFTGIISKEWENARIIVVYGNNQSYYLTKNVKLDQNS